MRSALFGKLPTHGDFVSRGLAAAEQAAWDGWLSDGLALARDVLGERFEDAHDAAPPWRFVQRAGEGGTRLQAGCIAPSVDRAGRRFWIVAIKLDAPPEQAAALAQSCEEAIFTAFGDSLDADGLLQALEGSEGATGEPHRGEGWWTEGGPAHPADAAPPGAGPALALRMLTPAQATVTA